MDDDIHIDGNDVQTCEQGILRADDMRKWGAFFATLGLCAPAGAERLERVASYYDSNRNNVDYSIDLDTVKTISGKRHVWTVLSYEKPQQLLSRSLEFSSYSYLRSAEFYDCENRMYAIGSMVMLTADLKVHSRFTLSETDLEFKPVVADTARSFAFERLCSAASNAPASPPSSSAAKSTGTGFRVADSLFVTNHHVVTGCQTLALNGKTAKVKAVDRKNDLALVEADVPGLVPSLRAQPPQVGESVSVSGYPLRSLLSGFNMTTGNVSSLTGLGGDARMIQLTAPVQPGNSGGPVIDASGNIVGVVVAKLDALKAAKITGDIPQNVNFAIHPQLLKNFLSAHNVKYKTSFSKGTVPTTETAEKAKDHTVLLECSGS